MNKQKGGRRPLVQQNSFVETLNSDLEKTGMFNPVFTHKVKPSALLATPSDRSSESSRVVTKVKGGGQISAAGKNDNGGDSVSTDVTGITGWSDIGVGTRKGADTTKQGTVSNYAPPQSVQMAEGNVGDQRLFRGFEGANLNSCFVTVIPLVPAPHPIGPITLTIPGHAAPQPQPQTSSRDTALAKAPSSQSVNSASFQRVPPHPAPIKTQSLYPSLEEVFIEEGLLTRATLDTVDAKHSSVASNLAIPSPSLFKTTSLENFQSQFAAEVVPRPVFRSIADYRGCDDEDPKLPISVHDSLEALHRRYALSQAKKTLQESGGVDDDDQEQRRSSAPAVPLPLPLPATSTIEQALAPLIPSASNSTKIEPVQPSSAPFVPISPPVSNSSKIEQMHQPAVPNRDYLNSTTSEASTSAAANIISPPPPPIPAMPVKPSSLASIICLPPPPLTSPPTGSAVPLQEGTAPSSIVEPKEVPLQEVTAPDGVVEPEDVQMYSDVNNPSNPSSSSSIPSAPPPPPIRHDSSRASSSSRKTPVPPKRTSSLKN